MSDALRYEWVRLRTLRSTYWLVGAALAVGLVVAVLTGLLSRGSDLPAEAVGVALTVGVAFSPLPVTAVLLGLLGVLAVGHEYRHGTIRATLGALPRRSTVVVAKLVVVAATCLVVSVVSVGLDLAVVALLRGGDVEVTGDVVAGLVGYVLLLVLWGALGVSATLLLRSMVLTVVLLLVLPLVVEPAVSAALFLVPALQPLLPASLYLPFGAGTQLAQTVDLTAGTFAGDGLPDPLSRWQTGAVFAGFVALVLTPAWLLFQRRDA